MRALHRVPATRKKLFLGFLLSLPAVILFKLWSIGRQLSGGSEAIISARISVASSSQECSWQEDNGPLLYRIKHNTKHPSANHWFHVAECFTGLRAGLEAAGTIKGGNDTVYLQVLDPEWMTGLTPMTRLFMTAGLASTGAEIHFVDTHRASFELPEHATHSPSTERGAKKSLTSPGQPRPGQVGVLRFGDPGIGEEFVMSTDQPLPDRLTVSAGSSPSHSRVGMGRGRETEGGLRGDQASVQSNHGATMDEQEARPVCVKYLGTVGMQGVHREDWFPTKDDALSMRVAIDAYCPISWLRDGGRNRQMSAGERRYGQRRRTEESRNRRLLIYQRDKNRVVVEVEKVAAELGEKLGEEGWTVEIMVHDHDRHPCEVIEKLAGVDVLVTAHGFQSMLALFMRPGSLIFEVFPHKYFKAGYAPMAEGLGVRHAYSESRSRMWFLGYNHPSTSTCMNWYWCRWYARQSNVEVDAETFERIVALALETRPWGESGNSRRRLGQW